MSVATCALCGHANPYDASFCNACGASLQLALCHACEAINHRTASTCHKCGVALSGASSIAAMVPLPASTSLASSSPEEAPAPRSVKVAQPANPALVAIAVIAVAAVAYFAYLDDRVAPPTSSTLPNASTNAEPSHVASAPEGARNDEPGTGSEALTTKDATGSAVVPSASSSGDQPAPSASAIAAPEPDTIPDEPSSGQQPRETRSPQAEDAPAPSRDERRQRPRDRDVGRDGVVSASPPGATMPPVSRAPASGARFEPPSTCTDAIAALGLCNRNALDKGN